MTLAQIGQEYRSALGAYLHGSDEAAALRAYELGRNALAQGVGVLEVAFAHQEALVDFLAGATSGEDGARLAKRASEFLAETLTPFEMVQRGFREASSSLRDLMQRTDLYEVLLKAQSELGEMLLIAENGRVVYLNEAFSNISGYARGELETTASLEEILPGHGLSGAASIPDGETFEAVLRRKDGHRLTVEAAVKRYRAGEHSIVVIARDITERVRVQKALEHQALHDGLTALPNRILLQDRLAQAILTAQRASQPLALLVIDLDNFREVNDTVGHHVGDSVLREVASRLRAHVRASDTLARLGGDEFALLASDTSSVGAARIARNCLHVLERPWQIGEQPLEIGASVGIALFPDHGSDPAALLTRAEVAMYLAKRSGSEFAVYSSDHDPHHATRLTLSGELRKAIEREELVLHYQPKVQLATGAVTGVEALARWQHPTQGLVAAGEFVPLAERSGLIKKLTRWVLASAAAQFRAWMSAGIQMRVAVNLSMRDLHDPQLPETIAYLLGETGIDAEQLELEITESVLMADPELTIRHLSRVRNMDVRVAIDDFGTGYSSLAYLQRLAIDTLKIDRSFVSRASTDEGSLSIVRATIDLAHSLKLEVVAEGVEDAATAALLAGLGCEAAQGYHFARPMAASELERWLVHRSAERSPDGVAVR